MILITGANGQIGVDLTKALSERLGSDHILATDLSQKSAGLPPGIAFENLDIRDAGQLNDILDRHRFETVYHLAGILSAKGENNPELCWDVNVGGLLNVLNACRQTPFRIFWPSSIAVFGPTTPRDMAPQSASTDPETMYGITKLAGEQLCRYHANRFGIDVRGLRFPGVISYSTPPGGGTTDYAVDMFVAAVNNTPYTCFVSEETRLPMMYMPDAVKSVLDLMEAPDRDISVRTSYNVAGFSFSASELAAAIRKVVPGYSCRFEPDFRQAIADSWPRSVDDSIAREDWKWAPDYDLEGMVADMLNHMAPAKVPPLSSKLS